jgi:hypothetical protein
MTIQPVEDLGHRRRQRNDPGIAIVGTVIVFRSISTFTASFKKLSAMRRTPFGIVALNSAVCLSAGVCDKINSTSS